MNQLYAHAFWGPRSNSQGTRSSASGAGAGADRAGLRSACLGGGADSAEIGLGGQVCVGCRRPAHVGSDAAEAPPTGDGDGQRTQFRRCLSCGQVRPRTPAPQSHAQFAAPGREGGNLPLSMP